MDLSDNNLILFPSSKNHPVVDYSTLNGAINSSLDRPNEELKRRTGDIEQVQSLPAIFLGDFPQLDFEIDLLSFEELSEMLVKQNILLEEQHARLTFYLDEIKEFLEL